MALGVGAQSHWMALERFHHALQVALEGIEVEYQRGSVDGVHKIGGMGCFPGGHGGSTLVRGSKKQVL